MSNAKITVEKIEADIDDMVRRSKARKLYEKLGDDLSEGIEDFVESYLATLKLGPAQIITDYDVTLVVELTDDIARRLTIAILTQSGNANVNTRA